MSKRKISKDWEKHLEAMQDERFPYWQIFIEQMNRHSQREPNHVAGSYHGHWRFQGFHNYSSLDELTQEMEKRDEKGREDKNSLGRNPEYLGDGSYFPTLTVLTVNDDKQTYFVLLSSRERLKEPFGSEVRYGLRGKIAEQIFTRGLGCNDSNWGREEFLTTIGFEPDFHGYLAFYVDLRKGHSLESELLNQSDRTRGRKTAHDLNTFEYNGLRLERLARDASQFQRIMNCDEYRDFEREYKEAVNYLAKTFANTADPTSLVKGFTLPALFGRVIK